MKASGFRVRVWDHGNGLSCTANGHNAGLYAYVDYMIYVSMSKQCQLYWLAEDAHKGTFVLQH